MDPGHTNDIHLPQRLILPVSIKHIVSITCGKHHTVAVIKLDTVYVWGGNEWGQLGLGDTKNRNTPRKLNF